MSKPIFIAATYAKPGRQKELLSCYVNEHLPDVRSVPGIGTVTLYLVAPYKMPENIPPPDAFIVHELDGDPDTTIATLSAYAVAGKIRHTDALDGTKSIVFIARPYSG